MHFTNYIPTIIAIKDRHNMTEKNNICKVYYHFTFPWLITYRCGNCYNFLGDNLDYSKNQEYKYPKCGYINITQVLLA